MKEKVSVVVPIYKVEQYLGRCIESICRQSYSNLEIILVDDGSPDQCPKICDDYAKKDERIKVIHKANGGLSSARNAGIDIMSGEYVTYIDSDDFLAEDAIARWVEEIEKYQADIVVGDFCLYYGNKKCEEVRKDDLQVITAEQMLRHMLLEDDRLCTAWGKLYKRNLFATLRYPEDVPFAEDMMVIHLLFAKAQKIVYDRNVYYYYSQEGVSLVRSGFSINKLNRVRGAYEWLQFIDKQYPQLHDAAIYRYMIVIINECTPLLNQKTPEEKKCLEACSESIAEYYAQYARGPYADRNNKLKGYLLSKKWYTLYRFIRKFVKGN